MFQSPDEWTPVRCRVFLRNTTLSISSHRSEVALSCASAACNLSKTRSRPDPEAPQLNQRAVNTLTLNVHSLVRALSSYSGRRRTFLETSVYELAEDVHPLFDEMPSRIIRTKLGMCAPHC